MCYYQSFKKYEPDQRCRYHVSGVPPFNQFTKHKGRDGRDAPPANVKEHDDKYLLTVYVPGFIKSDFEVQIRADILVVRGEVKPQDTADFFRYRRKEYTPESFERQFRLSEKINQDNIYAKYEDGLLIIELPKLEGFEGSSQQIEVM